MSCEHCDDGIMEPECGDPILDKPHPCPHCILGEVRILESQLHCNCDLDNWEPESSTGHSWVCRIHKKAVENYRKIKNML